MNQKALHKQGWEFPHSRCFQEKQPLAVNTQNYIQNNNIQENYTQRRRSNYTSRIYRNCWHKIFLNKTKVEIYREVFRDVSENFEGAENFIKQRIEEICERKKISIEEVFYFYFSYIFSVIVWS